MNKVSNYNGLSITLTDDLQALETCWLKLQEQHTASTYQGFEWVSSALETWEAGNHPVFVSAGKDGEPAFILPLVLEKGLPNTLRWIADKHINIGQGLYSRDFLQNPVGGVFEFIVDQLSRHLAGQTVLHLKFQPNTISGYDNPIRELPSETGPDAIYSTRLANDFDQFLVSVNAKRKRKMFRHQTRAAEKLGGFELEIPADENRVHDVLDAFFDLKDKRLRALGIRSVFQLDEAKAFMRDLAMKPLKDGWQPLRLYVLRIGGEICAIYGVGIAGNQCNASLNAIAFNEFAENSPGEMILHLMLKNLAEEGIEHFDLGIGYERYKQSWCKQEIPTFETIRPLGGVSVPFSAYLRYQTRIKQHVKSNSFVWSNFKKLRKFGGNVFR